MNFHKCNPLKKKKITINTDQIKYLEELFKRNPCIDEEQGRDIAMHLDIPEEVITEWFQNKRRKEKKRKERADVIKSIRNVISEQGFHNEPHTSRRYTKDQLRNLLQLPPDPVSSTVTEDFEQHMISNQPSTSTMDVAKYNEYYRTFLLTVKDPSKTSDCRASREYLKDFYKTYFYKKLNKHKLNNFNPDVSISSKHRKTGAEQIPKEFIEQKPKEQITKELTEQKPIQQISTEQTPKEHMPKEQTPLTKHLGQDLSKMAASSSQTNERRVNIINEPRLSSLVPAFTPFYEQPYAASGIVPSNVPSGSLHMSIDQLQNMPSTSNAPYRSCNCVCCINSPTFVTRDHHWDPNS